MAVTNQDLFNAQAAASAQAMSDKQAARVTEQASAMVAGVLPDVEAYEQSLQGTGADSIASWRKVRGFASALDKLGRGAADAIDSLNADTRLPKEHRADETRRMRRNAEIAIQKLVADLPKAVEEHVQIRDGGLLPKPHVEDGRRALIRDELRTALGGKVDFESARDYLASASPQHAAELLGDFGKALFQGRGQASSFSGLTRFALESIAAGTGGTERQQATRRAVQEFRSRNIQGLVDAFSNAAKMHIKRRDG